VTWAITQLKSQHATVAGLSKQLGVAWKTLWHAVRPVLEALDADESRFAGVLSLGVDEHTLRASPSRGPS